MGKNKNNPIAPSGDSGNPAEYDLHLFITGASPHSTRAVTNIKRICEKHLAGRYHLRIVDVYHETDILRDEDILALPLLIKKLPLPKRKMIGDLSDTERVLKGLGLTD